MDYALRRVTLAGSPVQLAAVGYRMLAELAANAGRVLTYEHLLQRVWGPDNNGDSGPCAPWSTPCVGSWATTRTCPPTSSPSRGWATAWRMGICRSRKRNDRGDLAA